MKQSLALIAVVAANPVLADEPRQLDAHEHGVGALNIAIDGTTLSMELRAPGADIVGFEHAAESEIDRAAIDAAVATLATPLDLFLLPAAAECSVTQAGARLAGDTDHDHSASHEDHDAHAEDSGHSEFHADYTLACGDTSALTEITFAYFDRFKNARELEVQIVTGSGAQAFEVERDAPVLDLRSLF